MEAQRVSSDRITTLPQTIIEIILCLLPIEEAARTSILSRDWRYKWTTIPKLVFSLSTVLPKETKASDIARAREKKKWSRKLLYVIYQVLLMRQSPIHEFSLSMYTDYTYTDIDRIILHLSTNHTIKKLTLDLDNILLPLSLFSLHQLTDLDLRNYDINHKPILNGFGNLTSLSLRGIKISTESFLHLLSSCPSLKILSMFTPAEHMDSGESLTIMELFESLPVIERLTFNDCFIEDLVWRPVPQELPILLNHLKYFCFEDCIVPMSYNFLPTLIKCSPNLEKIKLQMYEDCYGEVDECKEYPDVWMEHLNELEIVGFTNCSAQMKFVKFVMMRSPSLKHVILDTWEEDKNEEIEMLKMLLRAPKASPVEIIVENCYDSQE